MLGWMEVLAIWSTRFLSRWLLRSNLGDYQQCSRWELGAPIVDIELKSSYPMTSTLDMGVQL